LLHADDANDDANDDASILLRSFFFIIGFLIVIIGFISGFLIKYRSSKYPRRLGILLPLLVQLSTRQ
jgi:heme/copper-type cytochrome/quinol oxidase subunit 2